MPLTHSKHAVPATGEGNVHALVARRLSKHYGDVLALNDVSFEIRPGEILTLLGPSGSGKTTLLKAIAGFEDVDGGELSLFGRDIVGLDPARRGIGMVFQNYALFPHMTVEENVGFSLRMRGVPKGETRGQVQEALALVELSGLEGRLPKQLSGGQQQRVALARAIVFKPSLLLLDEPFSALDRKLREAMQLELRRLQSQLGLTTVFVTHDQEEALILSDRIAVMNKGCIEDFGPPMEIYERPSSQFTALFIGESNLLTGRVLRIENTRARVELSTGDEVWIAANDNLAPGLSVRFSLRPERVRPAGAASREENIFSATVLEQIYLGGSSKYRLRLESGLEFYMRIQADADYPLSSGKHIDVGWSARDVRCLP